MNKEVKRLRVKAGVKIEIQEGRLRRMVIMITEESKNILRRITYNSGVLRLPPMSDTQYNAIKYLVEYMGGHWREKYRGFKFNNGEDREYIMAKLQYILSLDKLELSNTRAFQIKNNFYPTPDWLARKMVDMAHIRPGDAVLEPSAGRGAILKYIAQRTDRYSAVECNRNNGRFLRDSGYRVNIQTFESYYNKQLFNGKQFNAIVMNPPFSNELDIRHTVLAYNLLKPGGMLISLLAENSLYYNRSITHHFNTFIRSTDADVRDIPQGSFVESGTNVDVSMVIIHKQINTALVDIDSIA